MERHTYISQPTLGGTLGVAWNGEAADRGIIIRQET